MKTTMVRICEYGKSLGPSLFVALLFTSMLVLSACSPVAPPPPSADKKPDISVLPNGGVPPQTKVDDISERMITRTAGIALFADDGLGMREYSLYSLQEVTYTRGLTTETVLNALADHYTEGVHLEFMLLWEADEGSWTFVYEPKLVGLPLSSNWYWSDFLISDISPVASLQPTSTPAQMFFGRELYAITQRIPLPDILNSEIPSDLSSWVTTVLSKTESNPDLIGRMVFSVESSGEMKRVELFTDYDGATPPLAPDGNPRCVSQGIRESPTLYCRIVGWFSSNTE